MTAIYNLDHMIALPFNEVATGELLLMLSSYAYFRKEELELAQESRNCKTFSQKQTR